MLSSLTPRRAIVLILLVATATILGAWIFEFTGYAPCELCLKQRWAYYAAILAGTILAFMPSSSDTVLRYGLAVLALLWAASAIFGTYHSGVEWQWWPGPNTCTGTGALSDGLPDLTKPVVMCDTPAIRILGLSLAGWNAVISLGMTLVALTGLRR
jgi:disulfide bond formation protein DsbB